MKIDETKPSPASDQLDEKYGVVGLPYVVVVDGDGRVLKEKSFYGFKGPQELVALLRDVKSGDGASRAICSR